MACPSAISDAAKASRAFRRPPGRQTLPNLHAKIQSGEEHADVAQLVEQLIRNQQVIGSSPIAGSKTFLENREGTTRTSLVGTFE